VELLVEEMVAVLAACGGGRKKKKICKVRGKTSRWLPPNAGEDLGLWGGLAVVYWWRRKVSVGSSTAEDAEEREKEKKCAEIGKKLVFWLILDPIFSSLRPSNPPLFIGGGRGQSFLQWRKISALDSDGKDPNRWLKVGMVQCQIIKSTAAGCLSWPLWGGATSGYLPVSQ